MLTANATYKMNGVTVNEKIMPDGTVWKDATKALKAGFSAGALYKKNQKIAKVQYVTIHNTSDLANVNDDAEQYTRATYNENMNSSRVHFYIDNNGAWQNLKAGTGLCSADPVGSAEVSWHSGDGSVKDGGNMTSLSLEIIMGENTANDQKAKDNGARIAAWLLWKHGLAIDRLVTHTYWVNKTCGHIFDDADEQCTNLVKGKKWCPSYIFGSSVHATALANWKAFKATVEKYLVMLGGAAKTEAPTKSNVAAEPVTFAVNDVVTFKSTATRYNPASSNIPKWVREDYNHIVTQIDSPKGSGKSVTKGGETCVLIGRKVSKATNKSEVGVNTWVSVNNLEKVESAQITSFKSYTVKVTASVLNIRKGPGSSYAKVGTITDNGVYTIVLEDANGKWGKLKSGAGWICLEYTEKT